MAELEIKKVDFYDSELIGVQEAATGKVFTAINNVLKVSDLMTGKSSIKETNGRKTKRYPKGYKNFRTPQKVARKKHIVSTL